MCGSLSGSVTSYQELLQAEISDMYGASHHHSRQQEMDDSRDEQLREELTSIVEDILFCKVTLRGSCRKKKVDTFG